MLTLIIKLGAAGDVVRTSTLLHVLDGEVDWLVSDGNAVLLREAPRLRRCIAWSDARLLAGARYDRVINLEDSITAAELLASIHYAELFGVYLDGRGGLAYTESSQEWFDMSLASRFGKERADQLKLENRKAYQDIVFSGLGYTFCGQRYYLPPAVETSLRGDIAIAPKAGAVWPMKNWLGYGDVTRQLEQSGYRVSCLPQRASLLEHIGDVQNHACLLSGDSLPMHIALGSGIRCVTLFTCTSPWEIHGYGLQKKLVSSCLAKYFYNRDWHPEAASAISVPQVCRAAVSQCGPPMDTRSCAASRTQQA